jgi:hypothetical protein
MKLQGQQLRPYHEKDDRVRESRRPQSAKPSVEMVNDVFAQGLVMYQARSKAKLQPIIARPV